jgi:hypothetical protein
MLKLTEKIAATNMENTAQTAPKWFVIFAFAPPMLPCWITAPSPSRLGQRILRRSH